MDLYFENDNNHLIKKEIISEEDLIAKENVQMNETNEDAPIHIKSEEMILDDVKLPLEQMEDWTKINTTNTSILDVPSNHQQSWEEMIIDTVKHELKSEDDDVTAGIKLDSKKSKKKKCQHCNFTACRNAYLKAHIKRMHSTNLEKYKCTLCEHCFKSKRNLRIHIEMVHEKIKKFNCQYCHFKTYQKQSLYNHNNRIHFNIRKFKCDFCDYKTVGNCYLKQHMNRIHIRKEGLKCRYCDYFTTTKNDLKKHKNYHDADTKCNNDEPKEIESSSKERKDDTQRNAGNCITDDFTKKNCQQSNENKSKMKNFECEHCSYITYNKISLKVHIKSVHLNTEGIKCNLCDYKTNTKQKLSIHTKSVHLKNYKCTQCRFTAGIHQNLKRHIESVHLKIKKFECPYCNYKTNGKQSLLFHINGIHYNIKNYECNFCEYKSVVNTSLNRHINGVHLKENGYQCSYCGYCTEEKDNLMKHYEELHKKNDELSSEQKEIKIEHDFNVKTEFYCNNE